VTRDQQYLHILKLERKIYEQNQKRLEQELKQIEFDSKMAQFQAIASVYTILNANIIIKMAGINK